MEKKQYETPGVEVILNDSEDVIRTSTVTPGTPDGGDVNVD